MATQSLGLLTKNTKKHEGHEARILKIFVSFVLFVFFVAFTRPRQGFETYAAIAPCIQRRVRSRP
jgi:hypothetical protein